MKTKTQTVTIRIPKEKTKVYKRDLKEYREITGHFLSMTKLCEAAFEDFHARVERMRNEERDPIIND